jgi:hypothetical protein
MERSGRGQLNVELLSLNLLGVPEEISRIIGLNSWHRIKPESPQIHWSN